jgi:chemotaxis protein MotB
VARRRSGSSASNGVADRVSLIVKYPADPRNRRVAITLFCHCGLFAK